MVVKYIRIGELYFWLKNYPNDLKDIRNRHYELLTFSATHAYIRNLRTGVTINYPINDFRKNFENNQMLRRK